MAGLFCYARSAAVTVGTASGWKTGLQLKAPTNQRVNVTSWGAYCRGVTNSDKPIRLRLVRQSDAGSGGQAVTIGKTNTTFAETIQSTALGAAWSTTEPTVTGEALDEKTVHPQAGVENPSYDRGQWQLAGGERVAVQYDNEGGGSSISVIFDVKFEE